MLGFLAYEGFELIANASGNIAEPRRALPVAFLGSVAIAILIYVLAFIVAIGHMSFEAVAASRDFAASEAAGVVLGPIGFGLMTLGAVLAAASAINADYFGAAKLPDLLSRDDDLPSAFQRRVRGQSIDSLAVIGVFALVAVNFLGVHALSAATSGGFLIVFAAVNLAAIRLRGETGAKPWMPALALGLCLAALLVMLAEFLSSAATVPSALAVVGIAVLSIAVEAIFRAVHADR
jgi:amino acid transporter